MARPAYRSRTLRAFVWLTVVYVVCASGLLLYTYRQESQLSDVSLRSVIWGRDEPARTTSTAEDVAARRAAMARASVVIATVVYALVGMVVAGPRPLKLVSTSLLALVLGLLLLEAATHALGLHYPGVPRVTESNRNLSIYDPTKGWFHAPEGTGFVPMGGPDDAAVRINTLGLRGPEIDLQKPPGTTRILVLGDSFAFGLGVDEEHLFTTHLERVLDQTGDYEVVNMGVLGYATDQELILFQELGMKLEPDLVILLACDNDFLGNTEDFVYRRYYKPYFELKEDGELLAFNQPVPRLSRWQRVKLFLGQESNVWNLFRSRRSNPPFFQVGVARASSMDPVALTAALVWALNERVEATGARFLVINTGHRGEKTPLFHELRPKLDGIPQLGLEGFLAKARDDAPGRPWDFPEDTHWNRDSHQLAAEIIAGHVVRHGLLP